MTVMEAIRKATRMKRFGWALMLGAAIQFAMFLVLFAYDFGEHLKPLLATPGNAIQELCDLIFQETSFLMPLWSITPRIDIYDPLHVDTLLLFGILMIFVTGAYIRDCGKELAQDVAVIRKKARDEIWLRSMLPHASQTVINQPASVVVLSLPMPPGEGKSWWERPMGCCSWG
ncbi:YniB family protein [Pseudomonas sp. NPDC090233]|uniref:YniB family protein n=1 Tax=Pseudomonas sp. NPDC090233 TaxID=3364479 RepID=UPI00383A9D5C